MKQREKDSLLIREGRIFTPDQSIGKGWIFIAGGKIIALGEGTPDITADHIIEAVDQIIAPGFIDMHTHGGDGADFSDGTLQAFEIATHYQAEHGVTALQATTTALPLNVICQVLDTARYWLDEEHPESATILGVHVEGPFISVNQRGCQPARNILNPTPSYTSLLLQYSDVITEVTLAPELPGALPMVEQLVLADILVSAGHSDAYGEEVTRGIEAGIRHVTHIYSGMSVTKREGPYRIPGLLEMTLTDPYLTTEMIADGKHLPPTLMQLVLSCKDPEQLCLVSDSMRGAGLPEGQHLTIAGEEAIIQDGVAMMTDLTGFAGSITPLDQMLRNVVEMMEIPLSQALAMVTRIPATILGVDDHKGRIAEGMDADLVVLDQALDVQQTIIGGNVAFENVQRKL